MNATGDVSLLRPVPGQERIQVKVQRALADSETHRAIRGKARRSSVAAGSAAAALAATALPEGSVAKVRSSLPEEAVQQSAAGRDTRGGQAIHQWETE